VGPRLVAPLEGFFCGVGFIIASLGQSPFGVVIGLGVFFSSPLWDLPPRFSEKQRV
jgi:cyanate permease